MDPSLAPTVYNLVPQEVLQHMPGVHARTLHRIMRNVPSLHALSHTPEATLGKLTDAKSARELYSFLHRDSRM